MSFWPLLVIQLVVFAGLVIGIRRLLSRNLTDASTHLQGLNAEYARRHEELKTRLEEAERQYKEQMARAQAEAEQLIAQARQEAESSRAKLLEEAHAESERVVQQGLQSRDALRKEIDHMVDVRAIERACELIQQVLPGQLREDIQSHWLDELIHNGLAQLDQVRTEEQVTEAHVTSAFPLNEDQRRALHERLKKKLGHEITMTEETSAQLVAGLTITIGSVVLDGSLASRLKRAARQVQERP